MSGLFPLFSPLGEDLKHIFTPFYSPHYQAMPFKEKEINLKHQISSETRIGVLEVPYSQRLHETYLFLAHKLGLTPSITAHEWKFMRMRPANFPTIRIAQLSKLLFEVKHLFSWIIESSDYKEIIEKFKTEQSEYWLGHHNFSKPSKKQMHGLGRISIENIVLNTVIPILVAYGKSVDDQALIDRAVEFLQQIPPENNKITRMWDSLSWPANSAFDSQAQIELHNSYCKRKRCASCVIGGKLISPET